MPRTALPAALALAVLGACAPRLPEGAVPASPPAAPAPPPGAAEAVARLAASPRHGEWAMIPTGSGDSVRAWIVYPERRDPAPVVVVVHEIFGLTHWVRSVADQLAADGFVAVAPDLLSGLSVAAGPDGEPQREAAVAAIRTLSPDDVHRRTAAAAAWAMALPAARPTYGIVGYCWGGTVAFEHAARAPEGLGASVVYYGTSPAAPALAGLRAPVLGLYGENDARVNATIPAAQEALRAAGRTFDAHVFPGAGHGFLRAQDGQEGANLSAARAAWPLTVQWLRTHLGG
jgi:carboxymethylenebutenolidase